MLLREGENSEEAIMSQLTARGNLASDVHFSKEMSKRLRTTMYPVSVKLQVDEQQLFNSVEVAQSAEP